MPDIEQMLRGSFLSTFPLVKLLPPIMLCMLFLPGGQHSAEDTDKDPSLEQTLQPLLQAPFH